MVTGLKRVLRLKGRWLLGLGMVVTVVTPIFLNRDFADGKDGRIMGYVRVQNLNPYKVATCNTFI